MIITFAGKGAEVQREKLMKRWSLDNNTVKLALTTTSEQRPPVNNGQFGSLTAILKSHFYQAPLSNGHFFRSQGWPWYTGLTVPGFSVTHVGDKFDQGRAEQDTSDS
jgi:hypothetical protein